MNRRVSEDTAKKGMAGGVLGLKLDRNKWRE